MLTDMHDWMVPHLGRLTRTRDIQVLKTYGAAPYATALKKLEKQIKDRQASVNEKIGVKVLGSSRASRIRLTGCLGIRYRSCASTPLGCCCGSATHG